MKNIKRYSIKVNTIFMNSKNSKACDPHRLSLNLTNKMDLRRKDKYISLSNISIHNTWKNIKKLYKNNKFKLSAPTWNEKLELLDGSFSISEIQEFFEHLYKKRGEKTVDHLVKICINQIENRITFNSFVYICS